MGKSVINRRAAKAAGRSWRKPGMFLSSPRTDSRNRELRLKPERAAGKPAALREQDECPDFIPEKDNPYPLCDNPACPGMLACNRSAHLPEPHDREEDPHDE